MLMKLKKNTQKKLKNMKKFIIYPQSKAVAQGFLLYCPHVEVEETEELSDSQRGDGTLGSSGK